MKTNSIPDIKCSVGWIEFSREQPIKTWTIKNELALYPHDEFLSSDTFSAPDTVCIPIFSSELNWGLAFLKNKQQWVWVKMTPEGSDHQIDLHNEFGQFDTWPLRSPGEESFESDWVLCVGTITTLTKESSTIRSAPNDSASIVCEVPDLKGLKPVQPKFATTKAKELPANTTTHEDLKLQNINTASNSQKAMVKVIESKGDWIRVRPCDWTAGVWVVDTYDDVIGRILLKWHPSVAGWVKWRVPGKVKGSNRVVINIEMLQGC